MRSEYEEPRGADYYCKHWVYDITIENFGHRVFAIYGDHE